MIQLVWLTLLAGHTALAVVWWWMMPHGFPSSSTEYWVNEVDPVIVIALFATALAARGKFSEKILPPVLSLIPPFWMACAISSRLTFIESVQAGWYLPFFGGAGLAALWWKQFRERVRPIWVLPLIVVPAALAGWSFPLTQRAPAPATLPAGGTVAQAPAGSPDHKLIKLTKDAQLHSEDGRVVLRRDKLVLNVMSLLSFADRSPDRFWTSLAPDERNAPTKRSLTGKVHDGARWSLFFKDEDASVLDVTAREGSVQLEARSRLAQPVYSHANTWCELTLQGHHTLSVTFSPLGQKRVDIPPVTAPAHFAFVDESGTFHLQQASERQRGPFTELASGKLDRRAPLVLTFYDGTKAVFTVQLDDWAAQASTQLSPAAGWGVPENVIELERGGDADSSPVLVSFSLASTSIGRGTRSVGHAAGVYHNRVTITLPP